MLKRKNPIKCGSRTRFKTPSPIQAFRLKMEIPIGSVETKAATLKTKWNGLSRGSGLCRTSKRLRSARKIYLKDKSVYLGKHPLCQITMALNRISEDEALRFFWETGTPPRYSRPSGRNWIVWQAIPFSTQIHHRNKRDGDARLLNQDFWMAAAKLPHDWVEKNKTLARKLGLLCPINANPDGFMPDGSRCLTTGELISRRERREDL